MSFAQLLQQKKLAGTPGTPGQNLVAQAESPAVTELGHLGHVGHLKNNKPEEKPANAVQDDRVIHPGVQQWEALYGQPEASTPPPDSQAEVSPVLSVVARAHNRPEWVAARDDWHQHLFQCEICQRHHRQQVRRPFKPSDCNEGHRLRSLYEDLC